MSPKVTKRKRRLSTPERKAEAVRPRVHVELQAGRHRVARKRIARLIEGFYNP